MSRAKELADAHWIGYIKPLLESTKAYSDDTIALIGFHYHSAAVHFWGHGYEDASKENDKCGL
jgi:hypothetical protein